MAKVLKVTKLGEQGRFAKLTLQFRVSPDQVHVERLEGSLHDSAGYRRVFPDYADLQLIKFDCNGPVSFELEDV